MRFINLTILFITCGFLLASCNKKGKNTSFTYDYFLLSDNNKKIDVGRFGKFEENMDSAKNWCDAEHTKYVKKDGACYLLKKKKIAGDKRGFVKVKVDYECLHKSEKVLKGSVTVECEP